MSETEWEPEPGSDPGDDADFPDDPLLDDEDDATGGLEPAGEEEEEEDW